MKNFTNKYQLSKTLRFELKPVGGNGQILSEAESNQLFESILEQDWKIKVAYVALKPVMDSIHEDIINKSLTSEDAKTIDWLTNRDEWKKRISIISHQEKLNPKPNKP